MSDLEAVKALLNRLGIKYQVGSWIIGRDDLYDALRKASFKQGDKIVCLWIYPNGMKRGPGRILNKRVKGYGTAEFIFNSKNEFAFLELED